MRKNTILYYFVLCFKIRCRCSSFSNVELLSAGGAARSYLRYRACFRQLLLRYGALSKQCQCKSLISKGNMWDEAIILRPDQPSKACIDTVVGTCERHCSMLHAQRQVATRAFEKCSCVTIRPWVRIDLQTLPHQGG